MAENAAEVVEHGPVPQQVAIAQMAGKPFRLPKAFNVYEIDQFDSALVVFRNVCVSDVLVDARVLL